MRNAFGDNRLGGILLHPSSLPGNYGIGDFGSEIYQFIDYLHKFKQNLWQILPLGPTGYADSPYQCFSSFAGNPFLISPEKLLDLNLIEKEDFLSTPSLSRIDFGLIIPFKWKILKKAFSTFQKNSNSALKVEYEEFKIKHTYWLEDYSLFMSIKTAHDLKAWDRWEDDLRLRDKISIERWKKDYRNEIEFQKFTQFIFFRQWNEVKSYANQKNVKIIGDIPIFVAYDSVDVWAHPELYYLDDNKELIYVAGVPPDYFSATGQRWGNPLYRWDIMKKLKYKWWIERIKHCFTQVDILRIDHFRGFESYWQIDANEETAVVGKWVLGPGIEFFITLKNALGELPIIAEDLGLITPEVEELRKKSGFPGMKVLQFAFLESNTNNSNNKYLPHNYEFDSIVYTGTHDNQTTKSWYQNLSDEHKDDFIKYTNSNEKDVVGDMIKLAWSSVAKMAVIPLQDLLRLDDEARMNTPGTIGKNWQWRFTWSQLSKKRGKDLYKFSKKYNRIK